MEPTLSDANLHGTWLEHADLTEAVFTDASLRWADCSGADFRDAYFNRTVIEGGGFAEGELCWCNDP